MVGGQVVDVEMTGKSLNKEQLDFIYRLKTGALLEASFMVGAALAGVSDDMIRVLEETGKNLILRRLTEEYGDSMGVLGSNLKKMGYVREIKSLISEYMQYQITQNDIEARCEDEDNAWSFRLRCGKIELQTNEGPGASGVFHSRRLFLCIPHSKHPLIRAET